MMKDHEGAAAKRDRYHHGDLRRDLLRVAREEIARHGARDVTLSSLARLAGVTQPAPYRHFADRDALLEAVAADAFETLARLLAEAVGGEESHGAFEALALAYLDFGEANVEIYRLMFASRLTPKAQDGSALDLAAQQAFYLLRRTLASRPGAVDSAELEDDAYRTWAQLHGLVMLKADGFIARPLARFVSPRFVAVEPRASDPEVTA